MTKEEMEKVRDELETPEEMKAFDKGHQSGMLMFYEIALCESKQFHAAIRVVFISMINEIKNRE
jgi:hypothetical protein